MPYQNENKDPRISDLVWQFENSLEKGYSPFMDQSDYLDITDFYEEKEALEEALGVMEFALGQYPYSTELFVRKAQLLIDSGDIQTALDSLNQAEIMGGSEPDVSLLKAEALNAMDDYRGAIDVLNDAKIGHKTDVLSEIFLCEAYIHEYRESYEAMFYALINAIKADPENHLALDRMWLCVELSEQFIESIRFHKNFLDEYPYSHLAWYNLGHAYANVGQFKKAIESYEYAFLINEDFEFAYRDCAEACIRIEEYSKGLDVLNEASKRFKTDGDMVAKIGQCYELSGDLVKAKFYYKQALELDPLNSEIYFRMGECLSKEGNWKSAISSYERALSLDDKKEEYMAAMAEAHLEIGEVNIAHELFKKAIELAPDQVKYWIQYASFLLENGDSESALSTLEEAKYYSGGQELKTAEIACLFFMGKRKEALLKLNTLLSYTGNAYEKLFDIAPGLKTDQDVLDVIATFYRNS